MDGLLEEFKSIGFNEYKAKVFITLSSGKILSASEIAELSKIARGSVYDILKEFVSKGYCNEIETNRVLQYQIIDPDIILDKIAKEYNEAHNSKLASLNNTFTKLKENYNTEQNDESKFINIELIRGYNQHRISKYRELLVSAKNEICAMFKFKGIVNDDVDEVASEFMKKGGSLRTIYQIGLDFKIVKGDEVFEATPGQLIEVCKKFEAAGEQIRLSEFEIPNMSIIDGENVFINTGDAWIPRQNQADIILRRSNFAKHMKKLFDYLWNDSLTIQEYEIKIEENSTIQV